MHALTSSVQRRQVTLTQDGLSIGKPGHGKGGLLDFIPLGDISVIISLGEGSGEVSGGLSKMPFSVRRNQSQNDEDDADLEKEMQLSFSVNTVETGINSGRVTILQGCAQCSLMLYFSAALLTWSTWTSDIACFLLLRRCTVHALADVLGRSSLYCRGKRHMGGKSSRFAHRGAKTAGAGRKEEHELVGCIGTLACRRTLHLAFDMMTDYIHATDFTRFTYLLACWCTHAGGFGNSARHPFGMSHT